MPLQLDSALERLARDPAAPLDLAEIALLLARDEFPNLDVEAHLNELAAMAHEVRPYLRGHLSLQVQGLCRYLFHEMGFRGNAGDYYDPRNSYLNLVLERRLGNPIALSIVALAVGQRAGLDMVGVALPGHFIVKVIDPRQKILIDPFHGGRVLSLEDCQALVREKLGPGDYEALPLVMFPTPVGRIVQRLLNNLRGIYASKKDWARSIRVLERLLQLEPGDAFKRRDLGISYFRNGQPGKAINPLRSYLDAHADGQDVEEIRRMLNGAIRTVAQWN